MISFFDESAIETLRSSCKLDPQPLRRWRNAFCKQAATVEEALGEIPAEARDQFRGQVRQNWLELVGRVDSTEDGATKLLFKTTDGYQVETVILRIQSGRTSLCVSTQVGCPVGCRFCATGQQGLFRNLAAEEILDQLLQANRLLKEEGRRIRNLVFMGMGEPLLNEPSLYRSLEVLRSTRYFDMPSSYITVSTAGIPEAMVRFFACYPDIGLALSLHSARQEVRERLIPVAKRFPLEALKAAYQRLPADRKLFIEYLLLDGLTDTEADVDALLQWCDGLTVHLNLIPYNPPPDGDPGLKPTSPARAREFAARLRPHLRAVTLRHSLGRDIIAACGQLAGEGRTIPGV